MKITKESYRPLELQEGFYLDNYYENYQMMYTNAESRNWKYNCTYQLLPDKAAGHHQVLHLSNLQVVYSRREGGIMQDIHLATDTISIATIEEVGDKMCFYCTKLKAGDIIFWDGSRSYNFLTNDTTQFRMVNIKKSLLGPLLPLLEDALHKTVHDTDNLLSRTLKEVWEEFTTTTKSDKIDFVNAEAKILEVIKKLLNDQTPKVHKLTRGEEVCLRIREDVYNHIDAKVDIKSLSREYNISERTMQTSFRSLFGITPNKFLRHMKLNHVYHNLRYKNDEKESLMKIAHKWGFTHMGHFTTYYKKLFGETPTQTRLSGLKEEEILADSCVIREEELL